MDHNIYFARLFSKQFNVFFALKECSSAWPSSNINLTAQGEYLLKLATFRDLKTSPNTVLRSCWNNLNAVYMAEQRRQPRLIQILPSITEEPARLLFRERFSDAERDHDLLCCSCSTLNHGRKCEGDKFVRTRDALFVTVGDDSETLLKHKYTTSKEKDTSEAKALFPEFFTASKIRNSHDSLGRANIAKIVNMDKCDNQRENIEYCQKISLIILGTL